MVGMKTIDAKQLSNVTGGAKPIPNPLPDSTNEPVQPRNPTPWGFRGLS
jgi:bacteriocin-like protein